MTPRWLTIADDLTGAADCAVAFAKRGLDTAVLWGRGVDHEAAVLAIDANSRALPASAAAASQVAILSAHWRPGVRFYKKIDSTLRGQPAAELAAQLHELGQGIGRRTPLAVVAPAFPATGRRTRGGRVLVGNVPLENTAAWARGHTYASASLPDILASAGLTTNLITLDVTRAGVALVFGRMREAERRGIAAIVCDCDTEADLAVIAAASLQLAEAIWVGSAGLSAALAASISPPIRPLHEAVTAYPGRPVLTVVGSVAEEARRQVTMLMASRPVTRVLVPPHDLLAGPPGACYQAAAAALSDALVAGEDALLEIGQPTCSDRGAALVANLSGLVAQVGDKIGALVVTGGETARAVLSCLGIYGIRLVDEVEPGVPLGTTLGALSIPVVTKAGAFGDADTLCRCVARLKRRPRVQVTN